jgi:LuxR family maltose regulon positive regulatory protein
MIASEHVKLWLEQGNLAAAALWLGKSRPGESGPLIVRELEQITAARVLLAQEKTGRALSLLASLGKAAEQGGRYGKLIEILVLKALAYQTQENEPEALTALGEALYLAEPEGYMRVFIDEGLPIAELLFKLMHRRSVDAHAYVIDKDYLSRLIAAIRVPSQEKTGGLSEELSEREKEVFV